MSTGLPIDLDEETDEVANNYYVFHFVKKYWLACAVTTPLAWDSVELDQATDRRSIPDQSGIYSILLQPGIASHPACSYLVYVGKSVSLRDRFSKYVTREQSDDGRPKLRRFLRKYTGHVKFFFTPVPEADLSTVEDALIVAYLPPLNDRYPAEFGKVMGAF